MTQSTLRTPDCGRDTATAATETPRRPLPARRRLPVRLLRRGVVWKSLLVAAASVLVQWLVMPPPLYADPFYVFTAGKLWPDIPLGREPFLDVPHQITRMGLVLPTMIAERLLGDGQVAYFCVAALGGCLFFVGAFLAVRSLFGETAGLVAALVLLVHPFFILVNPYGDEVTWATGAILPDMPGAGLFAMGVAALVAASRRADRRRQTRLLLVAGLCFGCAFLAREFLAFLYLAIPIFVVLLRLPLRRMTFIAAPMLGVLAVNLGHNAVVFGDPLTELRSAAGHGGMPAEPITRLDALSSFPRAMYEWDPLGTIFIVALALNVVGLLATRDRRLALTLVWFAALWAPLTLMSGTIDPTDISLRAWLVRYWFAVLPALAAGGLGSLILLTRRFALPAVRRHVIPAARRAAAPLTRRLAEPRRRTLSRRAGVVSAGALAVAVTAAYLVPAGLLIAEQPRDQAWSELRGWLADEETTVDTIWADERLGQTLTFYTQDVWGEEVWDGEVRTFRQIDGELPAAAVNGPLLHTEWRGQEPPSSHGVQPSTESGWELEWSSSDDVLELWERG
ncbi:glycosyltransferase family 39 protein [Actinomadura fulvescens]|uniref:Glycosyltransferase RgtA/B/C/D-like domain-containing protein n=1 Tax=Actinomadura fulvescens TaxID=46160 RepID=A0ABN3PWQ3_9ACTN